MALGVSAAPGRRGTLPQEVCLRKDQDLSLRSLPAHTHRAQSRAQLGVPPLLRAQQQDSQQGRDAPSRMEKPSGPMWERELWPQADLGLNLSNLAY